MSRHRFYISILFAALSSSLVVGASGAARTTVVHTSTADVTIDKNDVKRTIDCAGGSVTIESNGCVLVLKGDCSTLKVNGNNNTVTVDAVAEISTQGNRNKVTWTRGTGGRPPKISNPGTGNTIKHAEK